MLSYRHFRLMIVEELDPSKHLDEQLLKMLNGGGCDNRGRVCGIAVSGSSAEMARPGEGVRRHDMGWEKGERSWRGLVGEAEEVGT